MKAQRYYSQDNSFEKVSGNFQRNESPVFGSQNTFQTKDLPDKKEKKSENKKISYSDENIEKIMNYSRIYQRFQHKIFKLEQILKKKFLLIKKKIFNSIFLNSRLISLENIFQSQLLIKKIESKLLNFFFLFEKIKLIKKRKAFHKIKYLSIVFKKFQINKKELLNFKQNIIIENSLKDKEIEFLKKEIEENTKNQQLINNNENLIYKNLSKPVENEENTLHIENKIFALQKENKEFNEKKQFSMLKINKFVKNMNELFEKNDNFNYYIDDKKEDIFKNFNEIKSPKTFDKQSQYSSLFFKKFENKEYK